MFDSIAKLFPRKQTGAMPAEDAREVAARVLRASPDALAAFEAAYKKNVLDPGTDTGSPFDVSAAMAKAGMARPDETAGRETTGRIVDELLRQASYLDVRDGRITYGTCAKAEPGVLPAPVSADEIGSVPEAVRPQLAGGLMRKDIDGPSYPAVLSCYARATDETRPAAERRDAYDRFRQGLDILDLDPVLYAILGTNRNAMSHWLPALAGAAFATGFFKIPDTRVVKVPLPLLQLSRIDYQSLTPGTMSVVDKFCFDAFGLDETGDYFVKTGTYSSKFDFRNAHVTGPKEVRELGEYLLFIQNQACMMAGPLSQPSIYGMSTTDEWAVRSFVPDRENLPTIYKGLPLRTEYRVFVDLDEQAVLAVAPYWNPDLMKARFGHGDDAGSPHQMHDYVTFRASEQRLMDEYGKNEAKVRAEAARLLPFMSAASLSGQWSLDVMQSGTDFWAIDMALACSSALSDRIPAGKLRREQELSVPSLEAIEKGFLP